MGKLSNAGKITAVLAIAIVVVIAIVLGITRGNSNGNNSDITAASNSTSASTTASTTQSSQTLAQTTTAGGKKTTVAKPQSPPSPIIHIITPVANDIWTIGVQNPISWNMAGNISGSISLINAITKQFVGTILPQIGSKQTSYTWNARDLLLDRTNPLGKDVVAGTYEIEITYDGNGIKPAFSSPFTIQN